MITKAQFESLGISVSNDLTGNAALEWISENTTLEIDMDDVTTVEALPFTAKLFITKYDEIVSASSVVSSESIEGLSQSFKSTDTNNLIWDLANSLLSNYLTGSVRFVPACRKWL